MDAFNRQGVVRTLCALRVSLQAARRQEVASSNLAAPIDLNDGSIGSYGRAVFLAICNSDRNSDKRQSETMLIRGRIGDLRIQNHNTGRFTYRSGRGLGGGVEEL